MKDIESIQNLLEKEVSRREFLLHVGAALVAAIGISSLVKSLLGSAQRQALPSGDMSGYGMSGYSGVPANTKTSLLR